MADLEREATVEAVREGSTTTVKCVGAFDLHNYGDLHNTLVEEAGAADDLTVDLVAVDYIDTAVLADLARAANKMIARGKRLKVRVTEPSHPLRTLQITGFSAVVDVLPVPKQ